MYESTRQMAEAIGRGFENMGARYKIFNAALTDKSDLVTEIFKSKGVIVGSPTVNNIVLSPIAMLLEEMKGLRFKKKAGAGFGSFGWSGEAGKYISAKLAEAGLKIAQEPLLIKYRPNSEDLEKCIAFGEEFVGSLNK
jgi:anaerobic nitric oxide reductase flavorubredoxin